jgi:aldose 1-epimerase
VDDICIPTGEVPDVTAGEHPFNFTSARPLKDSLGALGLCGTGSVGIDNCFVFDQPQAPEAPTTGAAEVLWSSPATGIRLSVHTNQPATQLYSGLHFDGSQVTQVGKVDKYGCLAIEPQGW